MLFVFIYAYWCPTPLPISDDALSFNCNTTGVTGETRIAEPSGSPDFIPVLVGFVLLALEFSV